MKLFDTTLERLQSSLNVRLLKQNVLSSNVANVDTPGYLPRDVNFDKALAQESAKVEAPSASVPVASEPGQISLEAPGPSTGLRTGPSSISSAPAAGVVTAQADAQPGLDGNGVDLDRTMVALAQNGMLYGATARAAGKKLSILRLVASEGQG